MNRILCPDCEKVDPNVWDDVDDALGAREAHKDFMGCIYTVVVHDDTLLNMLAEASISEDQLPRYKIGRLQGTPPSVLILEAKNVD